jgi:hypothetical protein
MKEKLKRFFKSKTAIIIIAVVIILIGFRIALPYIVKNYVNKVLDEIPGYYGRVGDINMHLWRGAYEIVDVSLIKTSGKVPVPFFSANSIDLSLQWKAIFHGSLVGKIIVYHPKLNFVSGPTPKQSQKGVNSSWTDKVKKLFPLKINHFEIKDGEIHFRNFYSSPKVDIYLDSLYATATNLTNSKKLSKTLMATIDAKGNAMKSGLFTLHLDIDPYAKQPTFDLKASLKKVDLVRLNNFIKAYGKFDVEKGTFELVGEFAAAKGKFEGYVKPFFKDMQVLSIKKDIKNPLKLFWEAIVGAVTGLFKNKKENTLAARIPFSGSFKDPNTDIWSTIGSVLQNAFIRALVPNIEGSVSLKKLEKGK